MYIYKITNSINGKIYIGESTKDKLEDRVAEYIKEVKWRKNPRPIILAMRKYGFENFTFELLEDNIKTKEELDNLERFYITEKFNSYKRDVGYNVELGGNGTGKHSEETKKKIGNSQRGELNHNFGKVGSLNSTSKKVIDLNTNKIYESASLAAKELNLNFSHICACARGARGSTGGHIFRYIDEDNEIILPIDRVVTKFKALIEQIPEHNRKYI